MGRSILVTLMLLTTCLAGRGAPPARPDLLREVRSFGVQLHGYSGGDADRFGRADRDLLVVDPDGDEPGLGFDARAVERMRGRAPGGRAKRVLAYLSIGEAEPYRWYFEPRWVAPDPRHKPEGPFTLTRFAPAFLHSPNPSWPDNFKVRYWDPAWQQLIVASAPGRPPSSLDRILAAGFDGVYLDVIDGYEFFGPREDEGNGERPAAARDMAALVGAIARHARVERARPDFLVVPQNGSGILEALGDEARAARYLEDVDAIAVESAFHFGSRPENNALNPQTETLAELARFREAGKAVLSIEYLAADRANPGRLPFPGVVDAYRRRARAAGFVPAAAVRSLDRLTE